MVTLGKRCTAVRPGGDLAVARFADGSEVEADVIVGADGIHSPVRASLFGPDAPRFTGKICYRSVIPTGAVRGPRPSTEGAQWLGPHGTIVLYPLRGEELINVVCHYDDASYRHESWIAECSREEVLERYAGWHESLLRLFAASQAWYKWALYDRDPIPQWTRGRVTVLGDAAHPMLPYLGQGACQAIEDRAVLATALSAEPSDPVTGLARYERTRRPQSEPGGARRPRARAEQPPDVPVGDLAPRSADRVATAGEPARPGGARRGLARRLRCELAGRARQLTAPAGDVSSATHERAGGHPTSATRRSRV